MLDRPMQPVDHDVCRHRLSYPRSCGPPAGPPPTASRGPPPERCYTAGLTIDLFVSRPLYVQQT